MAIFFIAPTADKTAHFLDDTIHRDIPSGAVKVTAAVFQRMLAARSEGREILAGRDGKPKTGPKPTETIGALRARKLAEVKAEARRRIEAIAPAWQQVNDLRILVTRPLEASLATASQQRFAAIDAIRTASEEIESAIREMPGSLLVILDFSCDSVWPTKTETF